MMQNSTMRERVKAPKLHRLEVCKVFHGQLVYDGPGHAAKAVTRAAECRREVHLQGYAKLVELHRNNGEQADRHESLDEIHGSPFNVGPAGRVFQPTLRAGHHEADRI